MNRRRTLDQYPWSIVHKSRNVSRETQSRRLTHQGLLIEAQALVAAAGYPPAELTNGSALLHTARAEAKAQRAVQKQATNLEEAARIDWRSLQDCASLPKKPGFYYNPPMTHAAATNNNSSTPSKLSSPAAMEEERGQRIKAAFQTLAALNTFADITDPAAWQRETHEG